jgi:DNA-binding Lrp family transcriptional regulator
MPKSKADEFAMTQSDMEIVKTLVGRLDGLPWNELLRKAGLSPRTLSKRLERLQTLGFVSRFVDEKAHPPRVIYRFRQDEPPTKGDVSLSYEALRSFNYMRKLYILTLGRAPRVSSESGVAELIKSWYSRLYPYFLWCLYYGSRVETPYAEEQIKKFYLNALKAEVSTIIRSSKNNREQFLKLTAFSWNDLRDKDLKNEIEEGKLSFVSSFPTDLQDLAESFYFFYLNKRIESWDSMLEEFKLIVEDSACARVRREFEEHFGREVSEYRLTRFLNVLASINPVQSRPATARDSSEKGVNEQRAITQAEKTRT